MSGNADHGLCRDCHGRRSMTGAGWRRLLAFVLLSAATSAGAQVQPQAPTPPPPPPAPFAEAGPWTFTGLVNADVFANPAGRDTKSIKPLLKAAVSAGWDGSKVDREGWQALVSAQYTAGGHISGDAVHDAQGLDNIEAIGALRLYEAWVSRDYDNRKGWKLGMIDLNVDFDTQETGSLFINSSNGIGSELGHSGLNGPSIFPTTALGVTAYLRPRPSLTLRAGLLDGTAGSPDNPKAFAIRLSGHDGVLAIAQAEQRLENGVRIEGGLWAYSARFDALHRFDANGTPLREQRGRGAYATVEAPLKKEHDDEERGLSGWVRVGWADPVVERITGYVGGGLVYTGLLRSRKADQVGVAISHAIVDDPVTPDPLIAHRSSETALEFTYRYNANDWLALQPDAQFIVHPSGDRTAGTAFVVGLRAGITLTRGLLRAVKDVAP